MHKPTLRILVTGASGFIGRALVPTLTAQGHSVRAAARHPTASAPGIEAVALPNMALPVDWAPLVAGMDVVVHLAAIAHRKAGENSDYDQVNRGATSDLAAACKAANVKRLIFMSSIGAQAGSAADHVVTEMDAPQPVTDYDRAKLAAENDVRRAGVDHTILRPVIVYGNAPKANVALLAKLAALPVALPFGAFKNQRSLLSLDNLVSAVIACLEGEATRNQTFVVSDPEPISLAQMLTVMRRAEGRAPQLFSVPPQIFKALLASTGRALMWDRIGRDLIVNPQKLRDAGWQPVVTTEQGLTAMVHARSPRG